MLGALQVLLDDGFLRGFGWALAQVLLACLFGGALAVAIGDLFFRCRWLVRSAIRFLRIAMWIPLIVYWALPVWNPWKLDFSQTFLIVLFCSVLVVALSCVHSYLVSRFLLNLTRKDAHWWLLRTALLQSLFAGLISQLWLSPYGWDWYNYGIAGAYAATILVFVFVFIIERFLRTRFDYVSEVRGKVLLGELNHFTWGTIFGSIVIALLLTLIWEVLSLASLAIIFSSPLTVLWACYHLLSKGSFWQDVYVSFSEILAGIVFGTGATFILYRILCTNSLRERLFPFLPLLQVTFVFSPVILMHWLGAIGYWQKTLGIGLVTIYPILEAFWGLRAGASGIRLFLAINHGLPYAVVMMLFSEAMAATGGLGFSMVIAHVKHDTFHEGIAVALILAALLVFLSGVFQAAAKYIYPQLYKCGQDSERFK